MSELTTSELSERLAAQLDPTHRQPLYEQLAVALQRLIEAGVLPAGFVLPPETEFAERLGVARQTVNKALTNLARRGVVTRRRKVGTVVAPPYIEQPLTGLYSFLRTLLAQGRLPTTRLLGYRVTVDEQASTLLTGNAEGLIYELSRLRLVDGEPFVVETVFLPLPCGEVLPLDRLTQEALYDLLHESCGITVTHAEETLRPIALSRRETALLGLAVGSPAFLVERRGYSSDQVVEVRQSIIRGDRYRFRVHLAGEALAALQP